MKKSKIIAVALVVLMMMGALLLVSCGGGGCEKFSDGKCKVSGCNDDDTCLSDRDANCPC